MTKVEYKKCENLANEAIFYAKSADFLWKEYEENKENPVVAEVKMRGSDYFRGYAEGIYQALAVIGFKHDKMDELKSLL